MWPQLETGKSYPVSNKIIAPNRISECSWACKQPGFRVFSTPGEKVVLEFGCSATCWTLEGSALSSHLGPSACPSLRLLQVGWFGSPIQFPSYPFCTHPLFLPDARGSFERNGSTKPSPLTKHVSVPGHVRKARTGSLVPLSPGLKEKGTGRGKGLQVGKPPPLLPWSLN